MKWRAWYAKGQRYDSAHHNWRDLPEVGLQLIMAYGELGRGIVAGKDVYGLVGGDFSTAGRGEEGTGIRHDLKAELMDSRPETDGLTWKLGTSVDDEEWDQINREAMAAKDPP